MNSITAGSSRVPRGVRAFLMSALLGMLMAAGLALLDGSARANVTHRGPQYGRHQACHRTRRPSKSHRSARTKCRTRRHTPASQATSVTPQAPTLASTTTTPTTTPTSTASIVAGLREISYYPSANPWGGMWYVWQPSTIDADMAKVASLGANTVRVFVQPASFGYPTPDPAYISRLSQMLTIAANHGLKVHLTLFDLWSSYADLPGSQQWAARLLSSFRGDQRIAAIELQNEIDPTNAQAMSWAQQMLPVIRTDSGLPVTISVTGWNTSAPLTQLITGLGSSQPDFYDLHFYGTPPYMLSTFQAAKQAAGNVPLLIGETGYSTDPTNESWLTSGATESTQEQAQAYYFAYAEQAAKSAGLPPVGCWTLNDFPAIANLSLIEQHFGLYRLDGTPKPAATAVKSAFA